MKTFFSEEVEGSSDAGEELLDADFHKMGLSYAKRGYMRQINQRSPEPAICSLDASLRDNHDVEQSIAAVHVPLARLRRLDAEHPAGPGHRDGGVTDLIKPKFVIEGLTKAGFDERVIVPLGVVTVISALLYVIPRTSVLGAILITGYLGGAVATHVNQIGDATLFTINAQGERVPDPVYGPMCMAITFACWCGWRWCCESRDCGRSRRSSDERGRFVLQQHVEIERAGRDHAHRQREGEPFDQPTADLRRADRRKHKADENQ